MRALLLTIAVAGLSAPGLAQTTPAAPTTPATAPDPMDQMVCRRDKETGSLVKAKKTCHTRRQWEYISETNQRFARQLQDDTRSRVSGQ